MPYTILLRREGVQAPLEGHFTASFLWIWNSPRHLVTNIYANWCSIMPITANIAVSPWSVVIMSTSRIWCLNSFIFISKISMYKRSVRLFRTQSISNRIYVITSGITDKKNILQIKRENINKQQQTKFSIYKKILQQLQRNESYRLSESHRYCPNLRY